MDELLIYVVEKDGEYLRESGRIKFGPWEKAKLFKGEAEAKERAKTEGAALITFRLARRVKGYSVDRGQFTIYGGEAPPGFIQVEPNGPYEYWPEGRVTKLPGGAVCLNQPGDRRAAEEALKKAGFQCSIM